MTISNHPGGGNQILEIEGLESLEKLYSLDLSHNKIKEIKGLDNLVNLRKLRISNNQIREIKGLKGGGCISDSVRRK